MVARGCGNAPPGALVAASKLQVRKREGGNSMKAAMPREIGEPLGIEDIQIDEPKAQRMRVANESVAVSRGGEIARSVIAFDWQSGLHSRGRRKIRTQSDRASSVAPSADFFIRYANIARYSFARLCAAWRPARKPKTMPGPSVPPGPP